MTDMNVRNMDGLIAYREGLKSGKRTRRIPMTPIEKAHAHPRSLRKAVNGKCWECSNEQILEIRLCPILDCCLYPLRPYQ